MKTAFVVAFFLLAPTISIAQPAEGSVSGAAPTPPTTSTPSDLPPQLPPDVTPPGQTDSPLICGFRPLAIRLGHAGSVVVSYKIEQDGTTKDVTVLQTSGYPDLDETAADCIAAWRYKPATQAGHPIEVSWRSKVNFFLRDQSGQSDAGPIDTAKALHFPVLLKQDNCTPQHFARWKPELKLAVVAFTIKPDGSTTDISLLHGSGDLIIDTDAVACVTNSTYKPAIRGNEPVAVRWTATFD